MSPPLTNAMVDPSGEMPGSANEGNGAASRGACEAGEDCGAAPTNDCTTAAMTMAAATFQIFFMVPAPEVRPALVEWWTDRLERIAGRRPEGGLPRGRQADSRRQAEVLRPLPAHRLDCPFLRPSFSSPPWAAAFDPLLAPPAAPSRRPVWGAPAFLGPPALRPPPLEPPPLRLPPLALLAAPPPLRPPPPPPDDLRARAPPDRRPVSEPPSSPSISAPWAAESPVSDSPEPPVSSSSRMSMPLSQSSCMCAFHS